MLTLNDSERLKHSICLMNRFAESTGLANSRSPHNTRYLWTDAFALCNFLGLYQTTQNEEFLERALQLVQQVHNVLGKHREDDQQGRQGWISGLSEEEGHLHPTQQGLRIGKSRPEYVPVDDSADRSQSHNEWEQDGQYFHYNLQWIHALQQMAKVTNNNQFLQWAYELASASIKGCLSSTGRKIHWKMSIDLTRPVVESMGQHDALDGYSTCLSLKQVLYHRLPCQTHPIDELCSLLRSLLQVDHLYTTDPLGLGMMLVDVYRLFQWTATSRQPVDLPLLESLLSIAINSLNRFLGSRELRRRADSRLAFRELGLCIGLHAIEQLLQDSLTSTLLSSSSCHEALSQIQGSTAKQLRTSIEMFWLNPSHQAMSLWQEHRHINEVMLATSLQPTGFLFLSD
jgi:hypothetical protein